MSIVVIAVDDRRETEAAFHRALAEEDLNSTHFHLVHVRPDHTMYRVDELYSAGMPGLETYWKKLEQRRQEESRAVLDKFRGLASSAGVAHFKVVELEGDEEKQICGYSAKVHATKIVVGSPANPIKRMLSGGVTRYLRRHASCPVEAF